MEKQRFALPRGWLLRSETRRSTFRALGAGVLATGLSTYGLAEALAKNKKKNRRTMCKLGCPECQKLRKHKCQCKPKPDGTLCSAGTCSGGVCQSPHFLYPHAGGGE